MSVSMDLWGVTETGFYCPTIEDMKETKLAFAKEEFGEDFDTADLTPEGMIFRINSKAEHKLCEIAEGIYYSIFPHTAKGVSLDRVCEGVNLDRDGAAYAEHLLKVYGTQNYIIEAGTEFKNDEGIEFYSVVNSTITIPETIDETTAYYAEVTIRCKEAGTVGNINDINSTVELNTSITDIQYSKVITYGTVAESDPELREKYEIIVQGLGTNTRNAIIANTLRVTGINDVILIDNNTANNMYIPDEENPQLIVEAGTYAVIVQSDSTTNESDIALAIFEKQPLGVPQSGIESVSITDDSNTSHDIKFTYVTNKTIDVAVTCDIDDAFTSNGIQEIKDNITSYINGLGIGEEVIYTRLYDYIYGVTGVKKVLNMKLAGSTSDISINEIEIAKVGKITVTVEG